MVLIDRARGEGADAATMEEALGNALKSMSVKDAANAVSEALSIPRRTVYQAALAMAKNR